MLAYVILALFLFIVLFRTTKGVDIISLTILYCVVAPCIQIGKSKIDSVYLYVAVMLLWMLFTNKGKIVIYHELGCLIVITMICGFMFCVGWATHGANQVSGLVGALGGLVKNIAVVYLLFYYTKMENITQLDNAVGRGIEYAVYLNLIAVILQFIIPKQMYDICYQLYYSATSSGYTNYDLIKDWGAGFYQGRYYRYFGLFATPMTLSCFVIMVMALCVVQISSNRCIFCNPVRIFMISLVIGFAAQCKIFFLMIPILIFLYVLYNIKKLTKFKALTFLTIACVVFFFIAFLDNLSSIPGLYYLSYLSNPLSAFSTRFSEGGYIAETASVAYRNILTGVGPVSVQGEAIADSSYIVMLHNGGLIALIAMMYLYLKMWKLNHNIMQPYFNILIASILVMGASRTVMVSGVVFWIITYYILYNYKIHNIKKAEEF